MFLLQVDNSGADYRAGSIARDQQNTGIVLLPQVVRNQNKEKD